jgi:hypothetical protein
MHLTHQKSSKWISNEKFTAPQVEGVKYSKKQTAKHYKAGSQTLKKFLSFCSVLIQVQR